MSAIGSGRAAFWDALERGTNGASRIELEYVGAVAACLVPDQDATEVSARESRRLDRASLLAARAAAQALEDAGRPGLDPSRTGVVIANVHGGAETIHHNYHDFFERAGRVSAFTVPLGLTNAPVASVARLNGFHGPALSVATACAAGSDAIGLAADLIRHGRADAVLAGGAEAPVNAFLVAAYQRLGALSSADRPAAEVSRPFDRARDGFVIGEGAGLLLLEEREHALRRGARILAELAGYASTCDAGHLTQPDPSGEGPAEAITLALADARLEPARVGYLNAHATSTPLGDLAEARAITHAKLAHAPVSSTKALHGHTLGAAGGIEAIAALMPLVRDSLPISWNLDDPEPEPPLNYVRSAARAHVEATVSTSFGFGGHNAALVLKRPD